MSHRTKHDVYDAARPLYVMKRGWYEGVEKSVGDVVDVSFLHPSKVRTLIRARHLSHTPHPTPENEAVVVEITGDIEVDALSTEADDGAWSDPHGEHDNDEGDLEAENEQIAADEAESEPAPNATRVPQAPKRKGGKRR